MHNYGLYMRAQYNGFFNIKRGSQNEFPTYILNDKSYLLIFWMMTPFKEERSFDPWIIVQRKIQKTLLQNVGAID